MRTCAVCKLPPEGNQLYPMRSARGGVVWACEYCARDIQDAQRREPPEPDGEAFRGGEAAAYELEQQAEIQRTLK